MKTVFTRVTGLLLVVILLLTFVGCSNLDVSAPVVDWQEPTIRTTGEETDPISPSDPSVDQATGTDPTEMSDPTSPTTETEPVTEPNEEQPTETTSPSTEPSVTDPSEPVSSETEPPATNPPVETDPPVTDPPAVTNPPATELPHVHEYSVSNTVSSSCTNQGYKVYSCSCGNSYRDDYTEALGHSWGNWSVAKEATVSAAGEQIRRCNRCSATEYQPIEKIPAEVAQADIAKAVVKYINQFRAEEGSTQMTYLPGMSQVAQYRSVQLVTNFAHDDKDMKEATAYFKYGRYIDFAEAGCPDMVDQNYYAYDGAEAIGMSGCIGSADEIGKQIAIAYRNSPGHWRYLSDSKYSFIGVGCTIVFSAEYNCLVEYDCVMVGTTNYG